MQAVCSADFALKMDKWRLYNTTASAHASTGQPARLAGMLSFRAASLQHDVKQAKYPKSADGAAASPGI